MIEILHGDCLDVLNGCFCDPVDCIFADPPDNIGLGYDGISDSLADCVYDSLLADWLRLFLARANVVWFSFNVRHITTVGTIVNRSNMDGWNLKPCVQTFTFGQYNPNNFGNNHRPLWFFWRDGVELHPEAIKVPSQRQLSGDKRAAEGGRVPGDVFDFPRVTGNSKQRRPWHPTQLNEDLVERCLKFTTKPGDHVLDPFAGTGTTGRVCKRIDRRCTLIDVSENYCQRMREELL